MINAKHFTVHTEPGKFMGWPANNGVWSWGDEILVGFTRGDYFPTPHGHSIGDQNQESLLARSLDGGETWTAWKPDNFVGCSNKEAVPLTEPLDFTNPETILRVEGKHYHGSNRPKGAFFVSHDKGSSWEGPYSFGDLADKEPFTGLNMTPRTDVVNISSKECLLFTACKPPNTGFIDKLACVKTEDGGLTWSFVSWVVPLEDPFRAAMSQTARCPSGVLVTSIRRRKLDVEECWVDTCRSEDGGVTWEKPVLVGNTGIANGNPPALVLMNDGRLACVFGNRSRKEMLCSYSEDEGKSWGEPVVIRDDYDSGMENQDFGYPRLVQRLDDKLVAMYYWASPEIHRQHIAAAVWDPKA